MKKKMLMIILLLGIISASGCHTAERASIRASYYQPYPYAGYYYDPYPGYYVSPYYPAYFYDPYPYFFFGGDFFFFNHGPFVDHGFRRPRPSLRGGGRWRGGFSSPGPSFPAPSSPGPAPGGGGSGPRLR